jgi:hypothetical protein
MDTWGFIALLNQADAWHDWAARLSHQLHDERRRFVTTEWVLAEFLADAAKPPARVAAIRIVEQWRESGRVLIVPTSAEDWQAGFELFKARADKAWSLVDCISILTCQRHRITEVFSGDHHFEQAGLTLLKPSSE